METPALPSNKSASEAPERGSGFATLSEGDLYWEVSGPPDGEPLVLIGGLTMQVVHWPESLVEQLAARGFRVLRFDNRDVGFSFSGDRGIRFDLRREILRSRLGRRLHANYTLHDLAADVIGLLDGLQLERVHVVGMSMGGMVAQLVAAWFGERVLSLTSIMSNTNEPWLPPPRWSLLKHMFLSSPRGRGTPALVEHAAQTLGLLASPGYPTPQSTWDDLAAAAYERSYAPGSYLRQTHCMLATGGIAQWLPSISAPTQIVHGLADPLVHPFGGKRCAKLIPNARLELIPGMGHDLPEQLHPRIADLVRVNADLAELR